MPCAELLAVKLNPEYDAAAPDRVAKRNGYMQNSKRFGCRSAQQLERLQTGAEAQNSNP